MPRRPHPFTDARAQIAALFPLEVRVSTMTMDRGPLTYRTIAQRRAERRREFIRGRLCAKHALAGLGVDAARVGRRLDGAPHWPDGVVGSISHTHTLCAAVVARTGAASSVGLDIEHKGAATSELRALILASDEPQPVELFGLDNWLTALFSAKEATYKCHFPLYRQFLDFLDWRAAFHACGDRFGTFTIESSRHTPFPGIGRWSFDETNIYTGFSMLAGAD